MTNTVQPKILRGKSIKCLVPDFSERNFLSGVAKESTLEGTLLIKNTACNNASPQRYFGTLCVKSKALVIL